MNPGGLPVRTLFILGALLASLLLVFSGCGRTSKERRIEVWISAADKPQIRVDAQGEYWSHGSGIGSFRATIGPKLTQNHTVLEGELTWSKDIPGQALFSFTLSNLEPVTVILLGVSKADGLSPEKEARLSVSYPAGKHSFSERLFMKYTYD